MFLCDRELDLSHVRVIILAHRLRTFQVDFAIGANNRVVIGLDPTPDSFVCLAELVVRSLVNDAGHCGSGKLVDSETLICWDGLLQVDNGLTIDITGLMLIIMPDRYSGQRESVDARTSQMAVDFIEEATLAVTLSGPPLPGADEGNR